MAVRFIPNTRALYMGFAQRGQHIHLRVNHATATVFVDKDKTLLETLQLGVNQGTPVNKANGPVEIAWYGEVWIISDTVNTGINISIE